jgi:hypothetical protein
MTGVIAPSFSINQISAQTASLATRSGNIITKPDGWLIPDISKLKLQFSRSKFKQGKQKLYVTGYEPDDFELPKMNLDGTADSERKVWVNSLRVYDIDKRVFCYRMALYDVPLKGEAGIGVLWRATYYDLDGDGKFESLDIEDLPTKPLIMPQWAIKR